MPSVKTTTRTGNQDVDGLIGNVAWAVGDLTYSFAVSSADYPTGYAAGDEPFSNFEALNAVQRGAVRAIYEQISGFTNLRFTEATGGAGDLRFGMSDYMSTARAWSPSTSAKGGDSWYNNSGGKYDAPVAGNYAFATFMHEIGHTLGLKHGHDEGGMTAAHDSMEYSIMTYRSYVGGPETGYTNETGGFAQSFMMYDIAALQHLYGADYTTNADDTTYSWNPQTGAMSVNGVPGSTPLANRVFTTLWDGGGVDAYDLSAYGNGVSIDLRPGEWTKTSPVQIANLGQGRYAIGNVANALLVGGDTRSLIENARGGSGNDVLIGNEAANVLTGGGGADRLTGGAGGDRFVLSAASDSVAGVNRDVVTDFARGSDRIVLGALGSLTFVADKAFAGVAGELRFGTAGANTIVEIDLNGDCAADVQIELIGSMLLAAADFDFIAGIAPPPPPPPPGADEGDNVVTGTNGNDVLKALGGNDVIIGLLGDDVLDGGTGIDTASYADSGANIQVSLAKTTAQNTGGAGYDRLIAIENLLGGGGNDVLTGNGVANRLDGGAGNDQLVGSGGNDVLIGGSGKDVLTGGTGLDIFRFESVGDSALGIGRDRIADFQRGNDKIDLSAIDANVGTVGDEVFSFVGAAAFSGRVGELRAFRSGAFTLVEGDVNGDGAADFQIEVSGSALLTTNDFLF